MLNISILFQNFIDKGKYIIEMPTCREGYGDFEMIFCVEYPIPRVNPIPNLFCFTGTEIDVKFFKDK